MTKEDFLTVAQPIVEAHNLFMVDLKVSKLNDIELIVDAMDGVNISTCIELSREIESHFDRDIEDFSLTVASAGIGYPFKVPGQFVKNINKPVEIKFKDSTKLSGTLTAYDGESVTVVFEKKVLPEGKKRKEIMSFTETFPMENIKEIKDEIVF
ncbi:MAG: ribosome assembly cofactor RimP [Marinifilaceae bacterium]